MKCYRGRYLFFPITVIHFHTVALHVKFYISHGRNMRSKCHKNIGFKVKFHGERLPQLMFYACILHDLETNILERKNICLVGPKYLILTESVKMLTYNLTISLVNSRGFLSSKVKSLGFCKLTP